MHGDIDADTSASGWPLMHLDFLKRPSQALTPTHLTATATPTGAALLLSASSQPTIIRASVDAYKPIVTVVDLEVDVEEKDSADQLSLSSLE